jgi:tetrahydromethanopterin S-methyltransferase subunit H
LIKYETEQKVVRIGHVELGGQPGQRPTVMIGSIFFRGHRIVSDPRKGIFDHDKARALLDREAEMSAKTGNPRIVDVVSDTAESAIAFTEFVATHCDAPLLIDSSLPAARMAALRHFKGSEVMPRLIFNSIDEHVGDEEADCLRECGVQSAIVQPFSNRAVRPRDRLRLLEEKLLPVATRAGIHNIIVDVGVLDIPSVGWAAQTIREVKERFGLPAGCASANAVYTCKFLKEAGSPALEAAASAIFTLPQVMGASYVFYGPIRNATWAYAACGAMDAMIGYNGRNLGYGLQCEVHPLHKIV